MISGYGLENEILVYANLNKFYAGSEIDNKDGFIHLSTKEQLSETLEKHFRGKKNLLIISLKSSI